MTDFIVLSPSEVKDLREKALRVDLLELEIESVRKQNMFLESRLAEAMTKLDWMKFELATKTQQVDDMSSSWK